MDLCQIPPEDAGKPVSALQHGRCSVYMVFVALSTCSI